MRIYKYEIPEMTGFHTVMMPGDNGRVIHFGAQSDKLYLWAEVSENLELLPNQFYLAATSDEVPNGAHIGTVLLGSFVWHLYTVDQGG